MSDIPEIKFDEFWWKEIARFEQHICKDFSPDEVFVSDTVPLGKRFGIEISAPGIASKLFQSVLSYMESEHPDSSTVVASVFDTPMPAARLVIWREGCAIDLDALAWFLDRSPVERISLSNAPQQRDTLSTTQITSALPWLLDAEYVELCSRDFWAKIYSGKGCHLMEGEGLDSNLGYKLGHEISSQVLERFVYSGDIAEEDFFLSGSLPQHRILKVECAREVLNAERLKAIFKMVDDIHPTWGCRFSIFENLTEPDNYLGGVMITPDGGMFLEENK